MKSLAAALLLVSTTLAAANAPSAENATEVRDRAALERLLGNSGISLQWIGWGGAERGSVEASWRGKALYLKGEQRAADGLGRLVLDGRVVRVTKSEFLLAGTIEIAETPDAGRQCRRTGEWRFAITQNRKYWRLRQFEWCDGLTDYIDIYF